MDKLNGLYPPFRDKAKTIVELLQQYVDMHHKDLGLKVLVTEGFRTAAYQNSLWKKGRLTPPIGKAYTVTNCDGYIFKSNHQSSLAFDIAFTSKGVLKWVLPEEIWQYFGHLLRVYGLKWGGDWKSTKDRPHGEWDPKDKATYQKAKEWQRLNGLR